MSKRTRGGTREANKRRENHARKVWGEAELPKIEHWLNRLVKNGKRRRWLGHGGYDTPSCRVCQRPACPGTVLIRTLAAVARRN